MKHGLSEEQYDKVQLATCLVNSNNEDYKKVSLMQQILQDYIKSETIKSQAQVDLFNRAFEFIMLKKGKKKISDNNLPSKASSIPQSTICLKQQPLEKKYGYPYTAPSFGSLCLAISIINLYILNEGLTEENVENFMNDAKGKFIASDGNVISFEKMSKKLSELSGTSQYFDYVYYNPETKTYSVNKKAMSKEDFIRSDYDYGIGAYIHLYDDPEDPDINIAHYELIKRNPFIEYNLA